MKRGKKNQKEPAGNSSRRSARRGEPRSLPIVGGVPGFPAAWNL